MFYKHHHQVTLQHQHLSADCASSEQSQSHDLENIVKTKNLHVGSSENLNNVSFSRATNVYLAPQDTYSQSADPMVAEPTHKPFTSSRRGSLIPDQPVFQTIQGYFGQPDELSVHSLVS